MGVQSVGVEAAPHGPGPRFPHLTEHISRQSQGAFTGGLDSKGVKFWADANRMGPYVFGTSITKQAMEGSNSTGAQTSPQNSSERSKFGTSSFSSTGGSRGSRTVTVSELFALRGKSGKSSSNLTPTVPAQHESVTSSFSNFTIGSSVPHPNGSSSTSSSFFPATLHPKPNITGPTSIDGTGTDATSAGDSRSATSSFSSNGPGSDPKAPSTTPRQFVFSAGTDTGTGTATGPSKSTFESVFSTEMPFSSSLRPSNPTSEPSVSFVNVFSTGTGINESRNSGLSKSTPQPSTSIDMEQSLRADLLPKWKNLVIDNGANLLPKMKQLDLHKDRQTPGISAFKIGDGVPNGASSGIPTGVPFVFGATSSPSASSARPVGVPQPTETSPPETPPIVVPNWSSPMFKFSADGEHRGPATKIKKDKFQHRPLRQGQKANNKAKRTVGSGFRDKSDATTPSPNRDGVPMDFSPQDSTVPSTSLPSVQPDLSKQLVPPSDEEDGEEETGRRSDLGALNDLEASLQRLRAAAAGLNLGAKPDPPKESSSSSSANLSDHSIWGRKKNDAERPKSTTSGRSWKRAPSSDFRTQAEGQENGWGEASPDLKDTNERNKSNIASARNDASTEGVRDPDNTHCTTSVTTPGVELDRNAAWGPFMFTASPTGMATSSLRRRARKVQRERAAGRAGQAEKSPSPGVQTDTISPGPFSGIRSDSWSGVPSLSGLGGLGFGEGMNTPSGIGAAAAEQVCERWRLRGNQAYAKGDFVKAEEFYSLGAGSVSPHETSQSCIHASMLCYSNRAATRMVVGRMREALADCMHAMAVDPSFFRVHLRAASCHLALGETESATTAFKECLRQAKEAKKLDTKILSDASEGLKKAQQVEDYTSQVRKLLQSNSSTDTNMALRLLNEALLSSPQSEWLLELKAYALISLQSYTEAVQLCEQTLPLAERNQVVSEGANSQSETSKVTGPLGWRWLIIAKGKFHLGRLEESLDLLDQMQEAPSSMFPPESHTRGGFSSEMAIPPTAVIRDLLRHKLEGNKAFQGGKHVEALEHYTAALARNGESRPFCAVCLCNRAAASQALGHITDAIADCSRAIALDPRYAKAISRRAALYEKVRDYGQSCNDLCRLIALHDKQPQTQGLSSQKLARSRESSAGSFSVEDLQQAKDRLVKSEEELKKGHPLDHYTILGLELGCAANEIKKAYRKAALRHHPDKAGQFLVRSGDIGDETGSWKDPNVESLRKDGERLIDEVRKDAEQLFKLIGEAYAVLSDPTKRSRYDADEELRKLRTRTSDLARNVFNERKHSRTNDSSNGGQSKGTWGNSSVGGESGTQSRAGRQRDRWDGFNYQYQRWHPGPDAAQPDVYARRGRGPTSSNYGSSHRNTPWRWEEYQWDDV